MFTDTELGLAIAHRRNINALTAGAQAVIDSKNAHIDKAHAALELAYSEIRNLRSQLTNETARRQAAEIAVDQLKALARSLA